MSRTCYPPSFPQIRSRCPLLAPSTRRAHRDVPQHCLAPRIHVTVPPRAHITSGKSRQSRARTPSCAMLSPSASTYNPPLPPSHQSTAFLLPWSALVACITSLADVRQPAVLYIRLTLEIRAAYTSSECCTTFFIASLRLETRLRADSRGRIR
jgi:hypothetical protein